VDLLRECSTAPTCNSRHGEPSRMATA
jgi:hypothetical protein